MTAMMTNPIETLIEMSRRVGGDPRMVLAGGGNTSVKIGDVLHVKASGTSLANLTAEGLVAMDRTQLQTLAHAELGDNPEQREARYKHAIYAARLYPERGQRPSVECLLHHLVPGTFVVHSHATLVNAVTCCTDGQAIARELFSDDVLWIPYVDPGFTLARTLRDAVASRSGARAIFMANHGLIVSGDDPDVIDANTRWVLDTIAARLGKNWQKEPFGKVTRHEQARTLINVVGPALRGLLADTTTLKVVACDDSDVAMSLCGGAEGMAVATGGPITPDQIVYCHSYPMWVDMGASDESAVLQTLRTAVVSHHEETGCSPKVVLVRGVGMFTVGDDQASAETTRQVYGDAIAVMAGARRLGGVSYFNERDRKFVEEWEVESYRKAVAAGRGAKGPVAGRVAVVTGAAQGFGLEIAGEFARSGGSVVLADINVAGAQQAADALCAELGQGRAVALAINVTDPASIGECLHQVVRRYGGFDVLISNAGVLKAGSVKAQPLKDFEFVTAVNYTGYFLSVQAAAPILSIQHCARPDYKSDIIQINSKSGLQGSNRNGAYAGSKFGGIGLTQSFALELIEDGIKVNSICPGNFFDGPLWSDPNNGLFVQYLRTGKVPGAKTIADVRRFYEEKVPMRRGCTTHDVMKAIFYLIDQSYETGQALPVTGGQVMLS